MLKTRALTAAVLLAVFASALFFLPKPGWVAFCAVLLAIAVWEWGALAGLAPAGCLAYAALLSGLFVSPLFLDASPGGELYAPAWVYYAAGLFWVLVVPLWMWRRPGGRTLLLAAGALVLISASAALVDL